MIPCLPLTILTCSASLQQGSNYRCFLQRTDSDQTESHRGDVLASGGFEGLGVQIQQMEQACPKYSAILRVGQHAPHLLDIRWPCSDRA